MAVDGIAIDWMDMKMAEAEDRDGRVKWRKAVGWAGEQLDVEGVAARPLACLSRSRALKVSRRHLHQGLAFREWEREP